MNLNLRPKSFLLSITILAAKIHAQPPGTISPLAEPCGPSSPNDIICINKYAAVMPYHFYRQPSLDGVYEDTYGSTLVPNSTSWPLVANATFLIFDTEKAFPILGSNPTYDYMFAVNDAVHEAPVYSPVTNKLYFSQLRGAKSQPGFLPQLVINLNVDPPYLGELVSDPPIYAPNGGTIYNGLIYWGVSGGNNSIGGIEERPGIATLDPTTNKTVTILNNYFGYYFNTVDDLFVDDKGDVWFTDPHTAPQLETASYRFRPSTGAVYVIDDSIIQPNGIAISPRLENSSSTYKRTVYITDSGAVAAPIAQELGNPGTKFNTTGKRTLYAYDLTEDRNHIINKRAIYLAQDWVPDGLKVARNGYILTGAGKGVDILDTDGGLVMRVQTNFTVQNFAWTGADYKEFWIMGNSGVARVRWELQGQDLN
ncbi:hypothetical protein BP6252_00169 [Coleophoma cylindrospora]|uniref:Uncharacterized protein n=1 Tax=Coleophoma cylindrospora TaxID=1849047 RepID=A0A3D8SPB2_9HELO|nr:hypothetical protein BP6252_00169 [Coleophoma cylindrospora]